MKVSGFTFVKNAVQFDYPVVESILSILPLCDEMVVAVGKSDDDTLAVIRSIKSDKIKIIETVWDDSLREGGHVLAIETNKAFDAISPDSDWAFYVQADEVFHENDMEKIRAAMQLWQNDKSVEGLLFDHVNFYGAYDYVADSHKWIKKEIRIVRNDKNIRSWCDAMSFRKDGRKLCVKYVDATIYHYGWVKNPCVQEQKRVAFDKLWHEDEWIKRQHGLTREYDYSAIDSLTRFEGSHPKIMYERIKKADWNFNFEEKLASKASLRIRFLNWIRKRTGYNPGEFKNYRVT